MYTSNTGLVASYNHFSINGKDINVAFDNPSNSFNARTFDRILTKVQSINDSTLWTAQSTSSSLNYGNIQSLRYIIKPKTLNQTLCKLNSSSNVNITSGGGIDVTGISNEIVYINGSATGIININTWNTISINLPTPINANDYVIGNLSYSGLINDEKICQNILTNQQIKNYHNQFASKENFYEDFFQYAVGQKPNLNYQFKSGTWSIAEQTSSTHIQYELGQKYLKCTSSGIIFTQQKYSYGTFYFNNVLLLNDNDRIIFNTNRPELNRQNGYAIERLNSTTLRLVKLVNGVSTSLISNNILDLNNKLYDFQIQRKIDNTFIVYYKQSGGQSKWMLLNTSVIDSTYITSNYFSLQFGTNSYISSIQITQGIKI
jgi:hypothetical protein